MACDFYHRYPEDIALLRELGVNAFRLSVAWPRVLPNGCGPVNERGLDFYDRLVDALLAAGIEPLVTLYHWDLPVALEDAGGWPDRATVEAFCEYAEVVAQRLGDRVKNWITHNEPWVISWLGYGQGVHAPGRVSMPDALAAAHHVLLSHGLAVELIRRESPGAHVGITLDLEPIYPATDAPADAYAAHELDGERNRWFLDPVFRGEYPADSLARLPLDPRLVHDGDLAAMAAPLDFLGVNYYQPRVVSRTGDGKVRVLHQDGRQHTDLGWVVRPDGLYDLLLRLRDDYAPPAILIAENGASYADARGHDGSVHDPERQAYLEAHVEAVRRAIAMDVPVQGYFAWTLLDNFEWTEGYARRFGIVYVEFPTLERIPKSSFSWYRSYIARATGRTAGRALDSAA